MRPSQAGYALDASGPLWEQDLDNVDSVIGVNVAGLMHITRKSPLLRWHALSCCEHGLTSPFPLSSRPQTASSSAT